MKKKTAHHVKLFLRPWREVHDRWMKDPAYKKAYDALEWKYQIIGALIEARGKKGFSQEKLARRAGTTQSAIARFESGTYNPTIEFVEKLSNALGLEFNVSVRR